MIGLTLFGQSGAVAWLLLIALILLVIVLGKMVLR